MTALTTDRDPMGSFRAPSRYHAALTSYARARGCNRSEVIRAALRAYLPGLERGYDRGHTQEPPIYNARSHDSDEHEVFGGCFQEENSQYPNVRKPREAEPAPPELAQAEKEPQKEAAAPCLSGIPAAPEPVGLRVGHPSPPMRPELPEIPTPTPAAPASASAPRCFGPLPSRVERRPEWKEPAKRKKARLRRTVQEISEAGPGSEGQLGRKRKNGADYTENEQLAIRIFWHAKALADSVVWMLPLRRLSVALWEALCEAAEDVPDWETWEEGFALWSSHAAGDGPIAEGLIVSLWRFIDRPKKNPGRKKCTVRVDGPRFVERFADGLFIDWCSSAEIAFYGGAQKRAAVRSSAQMDLALEVATADTDSTDTGTDNPPTASDTTPIAHSNVKAPTRHGAPRREFEAELHHVRRKVQSKQNLARLSLHELKIALHRLRSELARYRREGIDVHPVFLERVEATEAEYRGRQ